MEIDKKQFNAANAKKHEEAKTHKRGVAEGVMRQAVDATNLTGSPEWDLFLSCIEAARTQAKQAQDYYSSILHDPTIVDANTMAQAKSSYTVASERVKVLDEIVKVPADIIKAGEQAKDLLTLLGPVKAGDDKEET